MADTSEADVERLLSHQKRIMGESMTNVGIEMMFARLQACLRLKRHANGASKIDVP